MTATTSTARVPALDGYRGVAVSLVLWAHLFAGVSPKNRPFTSWSAGWLPGGGLVGVQMFFVLSGYLITGILLRSTGGRGRLVGFWCRRFVRLVPALAVVCAGYIAIGGMLGFSSDLVRADVRSALTWSANFAPPTGYGWLGHTWSLAVEEQFYLAWPLLVAVGWRVSGRRGVALFAAAGMVATIAFRHLADVPHEIAYTQLRWDALLVGCLLACVLDPAARFRGQRWVGVAGAAVLGWFSLAEVTYSPVSFTLLTVAGAAALAGGLHERVLTGRWLRYLGRVSYSLYLWSILLLRLGWPGWVSLAASLAVADASYRLVERPLIALAARRHARQTSTSNRINTSSLAEVSL